MAQNPVDFSNLVTHSFVIKYESYVSGAAAALKLILKNFGTVIRTNIDSPSTSVGVDISKVLYCTVLRQLARMVLFRYLGSCTDSVNFC